MSESNVAAYKLYFQANEFFCGLSIPDPGTIDPLENKLPKDLGNDGGDFTLRLYFVSYCIKLLFVCWQWVYTMIPTLLNSKLSNPKNKQGVY